MPDRRPPRRQTDGVVSLRFPSELMAGADTPLEALDRWTAATALTEAELETARRRTAAAGGQDG